MSGVLGTLAVTIGTYRYAVVFFSVLLQGPVVMMGTGLLLRLGEFNFWPLYFTLVVADFVGDIIWYFVGKYAAEPFLRRFGYLFGVNRKAFLKNEELFRRHDTKIIFISKITMGFGFAIATLIAAGATRVPLKKYLTLNLFGGFIWTGLLMSVGYFLGKAYVFVDKGFRVLFMVVAVLALIAVFYGIMSFIRRKYGSRS